MKRLNPIGSILGLILTSLLFVGLGFSIWHDRGLAFSPGQLTGKTRSGVILKGFSSHSEFEKRCSYCHEPLKSSIADKCIECHQNIREQLNSDTGLHSRISDISECASCHPEHQGIDFDPTIASLSLFDHSLTEFNLDWHQVNYNASPMECIECHKDQDFSEVENQSCLDCHARNDSLYMNNHLQTDGSYCLSCHDGQDRMKTFDHNNTEFNLVGKHTQINCRDCHINEDFQQTPRNCQQCHQESTMHKGLFTQDCVLCHTAEGWAPAKINDQSFDHLVDAGFSLVLHQKDFADQAVLCAACHPSTFQNFEIQTCFDCHTAQDQQFMVDHQDQFGPDCLVCHDGVDRLSNFDHDNFFVLDGQHKIGDCADCHADNGFRGTPTDCWQCHLEPEIHKGVFGMGCDDCHNSDGWTPAVLKKHTFPLNHGLNDQGLQLQCDACHGQTYTEYSCYGCHDHQPEENMQSHLAIGIQAQDLPACQTCHPDGSIIKDSQVP
jgi:hypothetical protein